MTNKATFIEEARETAAAVKADLQANAQLVDAALRDAVPNAQPDTRISYANVGHALAELVADYALFKEAGYSAARVGTALLQGYDAARKADGGKDPTLAEIDNKISQLRVGGFDVRTHDAPLSVPQNIDGAKRTR